MQNSPSQSSANRDPSTGTNVGQLLRRFLPIATAAITLPMLGVVVLIGFLPMLADYLKSLGTTGPVLFYLIFTVICAFALLPTWVMAVVAGWVFGFQLGSFLALMSAVSAAAICYIIARKVSHTSVSSVIAQNARLERIHYTLLGGGWKRALVVVTLLRIPPNSGFAFMSVLLASIRVAFIPFIFGTLLGLIPRTLILTFGSSEIPDLDLSRTSSYTGLIVGGIIIVAIIALLSWASKSALSALTPPLLLSDSDVLYAEPQSSSAREPHQRPRRAAGKG